MSTPINNMFSIVLFDKYNMVQDAAMNIAGRVIRSGLNFEGVPLYWSSEAASAREANDERRQQADSAYARNVHHAAVLARRKEEEERERARRHRV